MVLWEVGAVQMAKEGQTTTANSGQKWLPRTRTYLIIGDEFWPMDIENPSEAPIVQCSASVIVISIFFLIVIVI